MSEENKSVDKCLIKKRVSFYIPQYVLDDLEACWLQVRCIRGDSMISKSEIVSRGIEESIRVFNKLTERGVY